MLKFYADFVKNSWLKFVTSSTGIFQASPKSSPKERAFKKLSSFSPSPQPAGRLGRGGRMRHLLRLF
jgi:hypothetical protein